MLADGDGCMCSWFLAVCHLHRTFHCLVFLPGVACKEHSTAFCKVSSTTLVHQQNHGLLAELGFLVACGGNSFRDYGCGKVYQCYIRNGDISVYVSESYTMTMYLWGWGFI